MLFNGIRIGSLKLKLNFNEVNIHIAKVFLVFTYDEGQSWFETEMVKMIRSFGYSFKYPQPRQFNLFLKIIDVFDEEFIDNNNENYYTVSYVCPPDPDSEKTKASQKGSGIGPQDSDSITESGLEIETYNDSELEGDKSFDLNDSDLEMTAHGSIAKDEEDTDA